MPNFGTVRASSRVGWEPYQNGELEILVVEQSENMRETLNRIFTQAHVSAEFADGLEEALKLLDKHSPRLIISEFRMPSMAAKVLVDGLKKQGKHIPVLVTTSQTGQTADLLVTKLGAAGYLSKPLNVQDVTAQIGSYLRERISTT